MAMILRMRPLIVFLTILLTACAPRVHGLLGRMDNADKKVHDKALARLLSMRGDAVPDLLSATESEELRSNACFVLALMGSPAVPSLAAQAKQGTKEQRQLAVLTLGMMAELRGISAGDREVAIGALIAALSDRDEAVRNEAFSSIGKLGPDAFPWLVGALASPHPLIRSGSAAAIARLGPGAEAAAPYLIPLLKDHETTVRIEAMHALGEIAAEPRKTLPALLLAARSKSDIEERAAIAAMTRFGRKATPYLVAALFDLNPNVRASAAHGLAALTLDPETAIPALIKALRGGDEALRPAAAEALVAYGMEAVNPLGDLLADTGVRPESRALAARAIAANGVGGRSVVHQLIPALDDYNAEVRWSVAVALANIYPVVHGAVEVILKQLPKSPAARKIEGLIALREYSDQAKKITPAIRPLLRDADKKVRKAAKTTIGRLLSTITSH